MSQSDATQVAGWRYEPPYSFYDWTADADDLALLLDEKTRTGRFFSAYDERGTPATESVIRNSRRDTDRATAHSIRIGAITGAHLTEIARNHRDCKHFAPRG